MRFLPRRSNDLKAELLDEEVEKTYTFKEIIGRGAFGVVNRAEKDGTQFAVKTLKCVRLQQRKDAEREIAILQQIENGNICKLTAACRSGRNIFMVMELCTGGELFDKISAETDISERSVVSYMRQICSALQYIHGKNIIHLDLKPENVVISDADSDRIKIIDFGGAQFYTKGKVVRTMFGTREYMAPETLGDDPVELTTDMWSAGVLCYTLLSGISPFLGENDNETECNIQQCEWDFDCDNDEFDEVTSESKDFISKLLVMEPSSRMSADDCLKHKWLNTEPKPKQNRGLSISLIGNLKALIARRRWNRAGTAMKALSRISSFKREEVKIPDPVSKLSVTSEEFEEELLDRLPTPILKVSEINCNNNNNHESVENPIPDKNSKPRISLLESIAEDIARTMKFQPPEQTKLPLPNVFVSEPTNCSDPITEEFSSACSLQNDDFYNSNHQKRTISLESTESGISTETDNSQAESVNSIQAAKARVLSPYVRKDSGLSSDYEEEDIIIIRRRRKRVPMVVKD